MNRMVLGEAPVGERRLDIDAEDDTSRVPLDNVARLMYYLHCVCRVLPAEARNAMPTRLTTFTEFHMLDDDDKKVVIRLAKELSPEKIPFIVEVPRLPDYKPNQFLTLNAVQDTVTLLGIQVGNEAMMAMRRQAGSKQELMQIMAYTPEWILTYYRNPLRELRRCAIM